MDEVKERQRVMWGLGDYPAVADKIADVGELVVARAGIEPGMDVLDVACGSATLPAARTGARVTGLDLSPELLAIARERAAAQGLDIEWLDGDAEELPFGDASFDRVISTFGHMFTPDQGRVAAEMRRVCRPGGAIAICCWTPEGAIGRMFRMMSELLPPPPGTASPVLWGTEQHVGELLGDAEFERHEVEWREESVPAYADFMLESFGPLISVGAALGERAGDLRREYIRFLEQENLEDDGRLRFRGEYLLAVMRG
ncbi:MAG TPA: class I SAM-dependent methyltransferase [Thermoleophilaceae bacterium]